MIRGHKVYRYHIGNVACRHESILVKCNNYTNLTLKYNMEISR